jgi:hypothetical protein
MWESYVLNIYFSLIDKIGGKTEVGTFGVWKVKENI